MSKDWVNEAGDIVHPRAPQGGGGPGGFRDKGPLGFEVEADSPVPHPHAPAARYLALNEEHKTQLKQRYKARRSVRRPKEDPALNARIKKEADALAGQPVVGSGECYDLADQLLTNAGAKSAPDFGTITATADYHWGTGINLKDVKPGDILQFRHHRFIVTTVKTTRRTAPDGRWEERKETVTETRERPHHTAVVSSSEAGGIVTVVEQNVQDPDTGTTSTVVQRNRLFLHELKRKTTRVTRKEGEVKVEEATTVTVVVSGTIHAYRPQPK